LRHSKSNTDNNKRGLSVEVRNGDVAFALRKFKKKIAEDGLLQELRQREFFEKPSIKRAKAKKAGIARWKKKLSTMNELPSMGKTSR
jgi:small subunit ribosomal protein S21